MSAATTQAASTSTPIHLPRQLSEGPDSLVEAYAPEDSHEHVGLGDVDVTTAWLQQRYLLAAARAAGRELALDEIVKARAWAAKADLAHVVQRIAMLDADHAGPSQD